MTYLPHSPSYRLRAYLKARVAYRHMVASRAAGHATYGDFLRASLTLHETKQNYIHAPLGGGLVRAYFTVYVERA